MAATSKVTSTLATRRASARRTAMALGVIAFTVFVVSILNAMGVI